MDPELFANPGAAYRGVALWMLNDRLEAGALRDQLRGMKAAGWGAVITRTFNGLRTHYLSEEWMAMLDVIVHEAAALGMKVWFQAGYMPSAIPDLDPALAHRVLIRRRRDDAPAADETVLAEDRSYAYVARRRPHVVDLLSPPAAAAYVTQAYEETWLPRFGDHFGETIEAIWVDEPHFQPPRLPWTAALPAWFKAAWGYDLQPHIPRLFAAGPDEEAWAVRGHYWQTVTEMLLEGYFEPVADWCEAHGVLFAGHLMGEDTLNNQTGFTGAAMPCYAYMGLPGIDHLTKSLTWPTGKPFILTPKQCASAAHQLDKRQVLAEMYAVSSQGITFAERRRIASWMMALGINMRCYHGAFYSLRGRRKRIYPPHLSHQQPWWSDNRHIADTFARLSYALQQGHPQADILVLHPVGSAHCLYDTLEMANPHDRTTEPAAVRALDTALVRLCEHLLSLQRDFDFGDETLLASHGAVEDGELHVGAATYRVVVLPDMLTLRASTLELLSTFAASGGRVIAAGPLPDRVDGVLDDRAAMLAEIVEAVPNAPAALRVALDAVAPPDLVLDAAGDDDPGSIWVHRRRLDDGQLLYLHNVDPEQGVSLELRLQAAGELTRWDPASGEVTAVSTTTTQNDGWTGARLDFAPSDSHLLVLREGVESSEPAPRRSLRMTDEILILHSPRLVRHDPNALTLDTCRYRQEDDLWSARLPVLTVQAILERAGYEGPLTLLFDFTADVRPPNVRLVVEDPGQYQIRVNGTPVAYEGLPGWIDEAFSPVEITDHVRVGANTIELSTHFRPLPEAQFGLSRLFETREGTELEAVHLTGDFGVAATPAPPDPCPRCVRLMPDFRLIEPPQRIEGDLVRGGFPFYAGRLSLVDEVSLRAPEAGERVVLTLPGIDAAALAKVFVNGADAGVIAWRPYELEITPWVRAGANEIRVELVSTLRNLLGPHHRPEGEPDQTWAWDYVLDPDWLAEPEVKTARWDDNYTFLRFGLPAGGAIRYLAPA